MGRAKKDSASSSRQQHDVHVYLNVYDLSEQNNFLYWCGFGVFHTGVEVFGYEYAYGGHDYESSGIFATEPKRPPGPLEFRKSIQMGVCKLTKQEVRQLVIQMGEQYKGNSYHLLQKNCNHFANDLCQILVGKSAPTWINRLAGLAVLCHCLLPASWVPPLTTPNALPDEGPQRMENHTLLHAPPSDACHDLATAVVAVDRTSEESFDDFSSQRDYSSTESGDWPSMAK